jgi:hypothetical protein
VTRGEEFDTRGRPWDFSPFSELATGDVGPWVWWLPLAWGSIADRDDARAFPPPPPLRASDLNDADAYRIAWWSPLLHLLLFGAGWPRPDIGLQRWIRLGRPVEDPLLATVERWWGSELDDFLMWCSELENAFPRIVGLTGHGFPPYVAADDPTFMPIDKAGLIPSPHWQETWGAGTDSLHLQAHVLTAIRQLDAANDHGKYELVVPRASQSRRATLLVDGYAGWYRLLTDAGASLPLRTDGRSWQIDVTVRRLGWLGTYRQSRQTHRWFTGRHRWHQLGTE